MKTNSLSDEKFYISYHKWDPVHNPQYSKYPYADPTKGGVLIWHSRVNSIEWANFSDRRKLPIDIESEHGKTIWNETVDNVINTGVANPLTGFDKLEIRKILPDASGYMHEAAGPYYGVDNGDGSIFYTPDDGKDFTFYTNPNSNWYNNSAPYAQGITSGFSIKNIRTENGVVKADFLINDYTVTKNASLADGNWYINSSVTVASGVTLDIGNANLIFKNGTSLTINGTLNAHNSTFTSSGTWSGIRFNSGSSGTIQNSTIENVQAYGNGAITIATNSPSSNTPFIYNNVIRNTSGFCYGIEVYNSSRPVIQRNTIQNTSADAIYVIDSSPWIFQNTIQLSNNYAGIMGSNYSDIYLGFPEPGVSRFTRSKYNHRREIWT